jgi:hypothetical protein
MDAAGPLTNPRCQSEKLARYKAITLAKLRRDPVTASIHRGSNGAAPGHSSEPDFEIFLYFNDSRILLILWSERPGSNRRHSAWEAG